MVACGSSRPACFAPRATRAVMKAKGPSAAAEASEPLSVRRALVIGLLAQPAFFFGKLAGLDLWVVLCLFFAPML